MSSEDRDADALLSAAERVLAAAAPREDVEVYATDRSATTAEAGHGGVIRHVGSARTRGVGVRVVAAGRTGYASTSDLTDEGLRGALRTARDNARLGDPDDAAALPDPVVPAELPGLVEPGLLDLSLGRKVDLAVELARAATAADSRVRTVDSAAYRDVLITVRVLSTRGVDTVHRCGSAQLTVDVVAGDGTTDAADTGTWWGRDPQACDVAAVASQAAGRAVRLLGPTLPVPEGLPLVVEPEPTAALLAAVGRGLAGRTLDDRTGPLAELTRGAATSPVVTLVDDGLDVGAPLAAPVDGEGVPRRRTTLVDRGALVGVLHSTTSAAGAGAGASTGNAHRASHRSAPGVAPTSLRLTAGTTLPALVASHPDAVHVQQLTGEGAGIRWATGRVGVGCVGVLWRGGEPVGPIEVLPLSTTVTAVLGSVVAVADDARVVLGHPALGSTVVCDAALLRAR